MRLVLFPVLAAVLIVLVASPVIAQEEITESLQAILDGLQAEITALTQAAEQRDQQLDDLDTRLSILEITCPDGQIPVNGVCQNIVCPTGYSLSGNECVEDVEPVTEPLYKKPFEVEIIDIELIDPEPVTDLEACKAGWITEHHNNGNVKSETGCNPDGSVDLQLLYYENGNQKSKIYYTYAHEEEGYQSSMLLYDENGNQKSATYYDKFDGSIIGQDLYDENGNVKTSIQIFLSDQYRLKQEALYGVHGNLEYHVVTYHTGKKIQTTYADSGDKDHNLRYKGIKTSTTEYYPAGSVEKQILWGGNGYTIISETEYYPDGTMSEQSLYDDNGYQISYTAYYPDGSIHWKGLYDDNGNIISSTEYYSTGTIKKEIVRDKDGKLKSNTYYNPDGTVEKEYTYEYLYYDNGNMKSETEYLDGSILRQTIYYENYIHNYATVESLTLYYPDGSIEYQGLYDENGNTKSETEYYPDGSIERQILYDGPLHMCTIENDPDGNETNREYFNGYTEC